MSETPLTQAAYLSGGHYEIKAGGKTVTYVEFSHAASLELKLRRYEEALRELRDGISRAIKHVPTNAVNMTLWESGSPNANTRKYLEQLLTKYANETPSENKQ